MSEDSQFMFGCAAVLLAIFSGIAALITVSNWAEWRFTTDTAVYELETGEYLHRTPQGGNDLACEVKHRKDTE
ncbi:hypothetical protein [Corynebacterium coyleae]|uniref:hypothetical protein n=1 Tax=Corynebacterium coyleae TaxID=53374 RepID=UPI00254E41E0|nr:hypothetical protein [Corynebacterium coyleae]MDK8241697.1 hypothetical protein [Corynebacterium coyleae]